MNHKNMNITKKEYIVFVIVAIVVVEIVIIMARKNNTVYSEADMLSKSKEMVEEKYKVTATDAWISKISPVYDPGFMLDNTVIIKSKVIKGAYSYDIKVIDKNENEYLINYKNAYINDKGSLSDESWLISPYKNMYN